MSEGLMAWLAEIRELRQQVAQVESDRAASQESATHWRKLYNIEARQRRTEAEFAQDELKRLKQEIKTLRGENTPKKLEPSQEKAAIAAELAALKTLEDYQKKLITVIRERDRALEALKQEQEGHLETRRSLTAIIGDTIEQLNRLRKSRQTSETSAESAEMVSPQTSTPENSPSSSLLHQSSAPKNRSSINQDLP